MTGEANRPGARILPFPAEQERMTLDETVAFEEAWIAWSQSWRSNYRVRQLLDDTVPESVHPEGRR